MLATALGDLVIHVTLSGDIFLKSRRTQPRMVQRAFANLGAALERSDLPAAVERIGRHRFRVTAPAETLTPVAEIATSVFGVASVDTMVELPADGLDRLADGVAARTAERVRGKTFAVRVKRRGRQSWRSLDLARRVGDRLVAAGGTVRLTDPEVVVAVQVLGRQAFVVEEHRRGPGGLPIGSQERVLSLVSGGFDSTVAAWMMMSRGCPVEFVHFSLTCAQSDHALAVAQHLCARWGAGMAPTVHVVEFQPVKEALLESVDSRMRQISLKVLMTKAAAHIATERHISAVLTGDALGQVSSQTLPHLVAVSHAVDVPILRPLLGMPKETIIDYARRVGTAQLSARAREVCDLSGGGPVVIDAGRHAIAAAVGAVPEAVMADAVATRKTFLLSDWRPGAL